MKTENVNNANQREIKFRAWDKEDKLMSNWDEVIKYAMCSFEISKNCVFMQFTGLKDKNGKEIYEGDVVTEEIYPYIDEGSQNYVGIIEWCFAGFHIVLKKVSSEVVGISDGINEPLEEADKLKVIGNIYENPELLEESK